MNIEKTIKNLELRGFTAKHFSTGAEASSYLASNISDTEVGIGGSQTAAELGLYEILSEKNTVHWHWKVPGMDTIVKANSAPVYICSANAISEDGEIINIDGNGNRLASTCFGSKQVYIVAGTNKIAPDFAEAVTRARNVAAVRNAARFKKNTPCSVDGKCHDCKSPERICKGMLVLMEPMNGMKVEIILIDENFGF